MDRRDRIGAVVPRVLVKFFEPELAESLIREPRRNLLAERGVADEPENVSHRRFPLLDERQDGIAKHVLEARPPIVGPELLEGLKHPRGRQRPLLLGDPIEWVEGNRIRAVGNVEIDDVGYAMRRHLGQNALDEIAMGIKERDAAVGRNVLNDERL